MKENEEVSQELEMNKLIQIRREKLEELQKEVKNPF